VLSVYSLWKKEEVLGWNESRGYPTPGVFCKSDK